MLNKTRYCKIIQSRVSSADKREDSSELAREFNSDTDLEILCDYFNVGICGQTHNRCKPYKAARRDARYFLRKEKEKAERTSEVLRDLDRQSCRYGLGEI